MAIADRINEMYTHVGDVYDTITNVDLPTNKNIQNIPSAMRNSYLEIMNNGIDKIWNNWEKVTGEGETLTLNSTEEAPMKIDLKGNTSQEGTPTPEAPQDVHVVSGDNSINVCGKNLFNGNWIAGTVNLNTGEFTSTERNRSDFIQVSSNTQYTIWTGGGVTTYFIEYDKNHNFIITNTIRAVETQKTFTTNENTKYAVLYQYVSYTPTNKVQLEVGSTATTYEEYKCASYPISLGDIELCKIGDYQDKIFKNTSKSTYYDSNLEDNVWYLNKQIGKVVYNGAETGANHYWYVQSENNYSYQITDNTIHLKESLKGLCNYFKIINTSTSPYLYPILQSGTSYCRFVTYNTTGLTGTLEDWKTWLSTHNIIVYYPLATQTTTEITDSTLISQLEALNGARSYNPQTNVSQENNDKPFILDATALKQLTQ